MKSFIKLFLFAIIVSSIACQSPQEENKTVVLNGKIENPNTEMIIFTVSDFPNPILVDTAYLNEDGTFKTSFELDDARPLSLNDGKEVSYLYISPGDSLFITLNTEEFDESILFEGPGAEKNNLMADFYRQFMDFENEDVVNFYAIKDTSLDIYMDLVNSKEIKATEFFNKNITEQEFSPSFISFMETKIYFHKISNLQYVFYRKDKDTSEVYQNKMNDIRKLIIDASKFENTDYLSTEYQSWLYYNLSRNITSKIRHDKKDEEIENKEIDSLLYDQLEQILTPYELQMYFFKKTSSLAYSYNIDALDEIQPLINKYVTDQEIKAEIDEQYKKVKKDVSQALPDDATLNNLDDEELLDLSFDDVLAKYKGNVIYLDFWASWCGPCKAEMPNSAKLSAKLSEENVVFLYVSTDKDPEAWEKMIRIMQLHGIHYRLGKNTRKPVFETYGIKYIPHYVIFDKEGNMVKNNMTRPSDPETEKMIRELL
jgi:thiol-disulfide isomerase/thioredoxin